MHYINEQITKTFEHLLNLRQKYGSINTIRTRTLYRIDQEKLDKYRSQFHIKHLLLNDEKRLYIKKQKENNLLPIIKIQKTISTQTTFEKATTNSFDRSRRLVPKVKTDNKDEDTEQLNTLSSFSEITESKENKNSYLSSSNNKTTRIESDLSSELHSESSIRKTEEYKFNDHSSKLQSKNCRVYIRSIVRHMLSDDEER